MIIYRNPIEKRCPLFIALIIISAGIQTATAGSLKEVADRVIESDPRNTGIDIEMIENGNELRFCVDDIQDTHSSMDVFRTFLQSSVDLKNKSYTTVNLCFRGKDKFVLSGSDFRTLGDEYGTQNPAYTIRTFPEKLTDMNGESAYPKHKGGVLYVMRVQMEDFRDMHGKWYMNDLLAEIKKEQDAQRPETFAQDEEVF